MEGDRSLNRRSPGAERPDERTLKSSTSKIPTERKDRLIQNGDAYSYAEMRARTHLRDHLRLQVAVKRGTLLRNVLKEVPGQEGGGMEMGRYSHPLRHQIERCSC